MPLVFILRTNEVEPTYVTKNYRSRDREKFLSKDRGQARLYSSKARAVEAQNTHFKFLQPPVILESIRVSDADKKRIEEQEIIDKENAKREREERYKRYQEEQQQNA